MGEKVAREKFMRISRRTDVKIWQRAIIIVSAILFAFLLCGIISNIAAPGSFGKYYEWVFKGTFRTPRIFVTLLHETAIMLLIAVALAPAFKMRFWNIGAEGQCFMGALGAVIGLLFIAPHVPAFLAIIIELLLAIIFAATWAVIPAIFKAFFNTNETLFTLMMNYIAAGIVASFVIFNQTKGKSGIIDPSTTNPSGWIPKMSYFNNSYIYNIIIVVIIAVIVWAYLRFSKHGYELSVVGGSQNTARYVGINVKKVIIRTVILSGAICGVVGFLLCAGGSHTIAADTINGRGFTAILVCWSGNFNVPLMLLYSFLVVFISSGSSTAADHLPYTVSISSVATAVFFIVVVASTFFVNFRVHIPFLRKPIAKVKEWFNKFISIFKKNKEEAE